MKETLMDEIRTFSKFLGIICNSYTLRTVMSQPQHAVFSEWPA